MKHLNRIAAAAAFIATTFLFSACGDGNSFTDPRDGQKYKTVKIGDQVWMAENLRYKKNAVEDEDGITYFWDSALTACPDGWHLPNKAELESIVSDTNFTYLWSSTENENFTLVAYAKEDDKIAARRKTNMSVRCVLGQRNNQEKIGKINGRNAVRIGSQIWMADLLDVETPHSICFMNNISRCGDGRYYPQSEIDSVCPKGWRLPTRDDALTFLNVIKKNNWQELLISSGFSCGRADSFNRNVDSANAFAVYDCPIANNLIFSGYFDDYREMFSFEKKYMYQVRCIADTGNMEE